MVRSYTASTSTRLFSDEQLVALSKVFERTIFSAAASQSAVSSTIEATLPAPTPKAGVPLPYAEQRSWGITTLPHEQLLSSIELYGKEVEGVIRSTFVIDEDGKVELAQYNVKATGHVAKLRRDLGLD